MPIVAWGVRDAVLLDTRVLPADLVRGTGGLLVAHDLLLVPIVARPGLLVAIGLTGHDGRVVQEERTIDDLAGVPAYAVEAAPAFIVRAILAGSAGPPPDVVLSGANHGLNTGNAILHSGTVGAALTGAALGARALAASVATGTGPVEHWDTVAAVLDQVLPTFLADTVPVLNLNVPDIPLERLAGTSAATLAPVGAVQATVTDRRAGRVRLDYTPVQGPQPQGSDMELLGSGHATVTSLRPVCAGPLDEVAAYVTDG